MKRSLMFFVLIISLLLSLLSGCIIGSNNSDSTSLGESQFESEVSSEESEPSLSKDVVLRFAAMSDIHINGSSTQTENKRFRQALDFMYSYSDGQDYKNFDLLLVAGDMTNYGYENELNAFKAVVDEKLKEGTEKLFVMGNHEYYNNGPTAESQERWENITGETKNSHKVIDGYHFIGVSPNDTSDFQYAATWLEDEIKKAIEEDPDKPIFVTQHFHISNTVYGSADWGTASLTSVLNKYPQVVNFSGHSHYPINDPRSIMQTKFTSLGCGTLSYYELEKGMVYGPFPPGNSNAAQFWVVEIYSDNSVAFKPYDLITSQFFPVDYRIKNPKSTDTFIYTAERANNADKPSFPSKAKLEVSEVKDSTAKLVFDHAVDSEMVHSYRYNFYTTSDNKLSTSFSTFSDFFYLDRPEKMTYIVTGLKPGTDYKLEITAIDSYGKESENTLTATFKTTGEPPIPEDPNAPLPDADFLDIVFDDKGSSDKGDLSKTVESINAKIEKDTELDAYVAKFTGKGDYLKIPFSQAEYNTLTEAISLSAKIKINEFNASDYMDALGNMQSGGYGFEITSGKQLEFWISIGGSYTVVTTPIEKGKYYSVTGTYDGQKVVLYIDGEKVGEAAASGFITYPSDTSAHAMCIGADVNPGGTGTAFFNGNVAYVKIHSKALTENQVIKLAEK